MVSLQINQISATTNILENVYCIKHECKYQHSNFIQNEESFGILTSEQTSLCRYSFPRLHPSRNCWMVNAKLFRRLFECVIKSIFSHFFLELVERFLAQPSMFSNNSQLLFGTTWSWAGFIGFVILLQTFRRAPIVATNRRRTWRFSFFSRPQCLIRGC